MTPSRSEIERLEGLARAATQGEWGVEDPMDHCLTIVSNPDAPVYDWKWVAVCDWPDEDDHLIASTEVKANAAYIAAVSPAKFLSLTQALRESMEREAGLRAALNEMLVAVTFAGPAVDFGMPDDPNLCFEDWRLVEFVEIARTALRTGGGE